MVLIRGGEFLMGTDNRLDDFEKPAHRVTVQSFYLDVTEVTCIEYEKFVKATGHKAPPTWVNGSYPSGTGKTPVTGVDWYDANAYAEWAKKRLPTEEEWEFAARGFESRRYPWGDEWRTSAANAGDSTVKGLVDVASYPEGKTSAGVMDMIGNAWEWTASSLQPYPNGRLPTLPDKNDKVIRGGSWKEDKNQATSTYRGFLAASGEKDYSATGFRCAKDLPLQPQPSRN
jgi:formylglycine-generating enzyme required for sulfatase activity